MRRSRQLERSDRHRRSLDRSGIAEELTEAVKHGLVFPMGVALFKSVDLLQVFCDGDMERLFLGCFASRFKARRA